MKKTIALIIIACLGLLGLTACSDAQTGQQEELKKLTLVLDWTPNTNHTGAYVALANGYFADEGLDVEIIQPGQSTSDALVASGQCQLGFSYQEGVTLAATQDIPIVSLAAVIQHNTSAFASPAAKNIKTPKDFEGKTYAGWGSESEEMVIKSLMQKAGADFSKVNIITSGTADFFTTTERDADFQWIFYAQDGINAELKNKPINCIFLKDQDPALDYYTPVIITSRDELANEPEVIKSAMAAIAKGYEFAAANPEEAADILLEQVPELDPELIKASQAWLSPLYQDDAASWGLQREEVWQNYAQWLYDHGLIEKMPEISTMFTNDYLPQ